IIQAEDRIYMVARKSDMSSTSGLVHLMSREPKEVFIIGGGAIGFMVARQMEQKKVNVRLIEQDAGRCDFLAENLNNTTVLNIDGLDAHSLLDEGLDQADLVIAVTDSDETNLLASLLAKHHGAGKCITRISRPDFVPLLAKLGIDVALSPRQVAANMILRFVRTGGTIVSAASLLGSDAEVVELKVPNTDKFRRATLQSLNFPKGAVLGAVVRNKKQRVIIPIGTTRLRPGDNLVIFALREAVQEVADFFAP
ncbi:MAG TPA: Trk system potassium transporter TrkA, partial [Desulfobacterales bacterium]|nr:Trk system potassium transporter TrkA [Desulfobacterales bacterium]